MVATLSKKSTPSTMEPEREVYSVAEIDRLYLSELPAKSMTTVEVVKNNSAHDLKQTNSRRSEDNDSGIKEESAAIPITNEGSGEKSSLLAVDDSFNNGGDDEAPAPYDFSDDGSDDESATIPAYRSSNGVSNTKSAAPVEEPFVFDPSFSFWSDDDDSESGIHESISAIQKEASRVDAVLALDQMDTMRQELSSISRQLKNRSAELHELRALVQLKEGRLGHLELERDLYKADADMFKIDLDRLEEKMEKIDLSKAADSQSNVEENKEADFETNLPLSPEKETDQRSRNVMLFPRSAGPAKCSKPSEDNGTLEIDFVSSHSSETYAIPESPSFRNKPKKSSKTCAIPESPSRRNKIKKAASQNRGTRFLCLMRRSSRKIALSDTITSSLQASGAKPDPQHEDLKRRLETSMEASQELRKRIGVLSRYYDDRVRRLQDSLVEEKAHRLRVQKDLSRQVTELQKERERCDSR